MSQKTYRDLAWDSLLGVVRESAHIADMSKQVEPTLRRFRMKFDAAVDAIPLLAKVLDEQVREQEPRKEIIDPINRADEIAARITKGLIDE